VDLSNAMEPETKALNLAVCPAQLPALDGNATALWSVLLRKVGVTISKGEHIEDRRARLLRNFGVDDLASRLAVQQKRENGGPQDDPARAMIWRHVAEASSPGDSIADIAPQNMYVLNPFIVCKGKRFVSPIDALQHTPRALKPCANEKCAHGPNGTRAYAISTRASFCSKSCRNVVSRRDGFVKPVRTSQITPLKAA
jgi:hypothetical protein